MKTSFQRINLTWIIALLTCGSVKLTSAQTLIVGDQYDVVGSGTGFALGSGVNSGINPPTTRLTGSLAGNLRYLQTVTAKSPTLYTIANDKLQVSGGVNSGRFTLSADGTTAFDFSSALGASTATAAAPAFYDITISMANNSAGTQRFSFALGTAETDATAWDFGLQLYRANAADDFYTIQQRIDTGSSGLGADLNSPILTTGAGTYGSELDFLIRVTDAGAETGAAYNSRLQVSLDGGTSWFYDTSTDSSLVNGWHLDGTGRYFSWDQAGNIGTVTYDNFSVTDVPEPSALALACLGGTAILFRRLRRVHCS